MIYRRIQRFLRALDAPLPHLEGPVDIGELQVKAGLKVRKRDSWLSPRRGVSKDKLTPYLKAFQLRCRVYRKPRKEALKIILDAAL